MSYTKKVGSQRTMKSIEDWYGLNKTTPDKWFDRWGGFLATLMEEIGYRQQTNPPIQKKRGKDWTVELRFSHPHLENTTLFLSRKRRQEGGEIHFVYGLAYDVIIDTMSAKSGYQIMSRQKVGDEIVHHVREGWSKSRNVDQED
jgi:hypothetical protein